MSLTIVLICLIQYYVIQVIVAQEIPHYSSVRNYISDLGNTRLSPRAKWMNASFLTNGILIAISAVMLNIDNYSRVTMILSAVGAALVAFNPSDKNSTLHVTGATMSFIFGNLSLLMMAAFSSALPSQVRRIYAAAGIVGSLGLIYYTIGANPSNLGFLERINSYPQSIALILSALYF